MSHTQRRSSFPHRRGQVIATAGLFCALLLGTPAAASDAAPASAGFLFSLSNVTGTLPLEWVSLALDTAQREIYVGDAGSRSIVIFNDQGMETFRFGDDARFGTIVDLAVRANGDILILSRMGAGEEHDLLLCDYRGEIVNRSTLPRRIGELPFAPSRMFLQGERVFLADLGEMLVAETDLAGQLLKSHDLGTHLGLSRREAANSGMGGFSVDPDGNLLFTVPAQFSTYRLSSTGKLESFGQPGSLPGRFGVVAGIASDQNGRLYIVDTLRCVVLVFDRDLKFITEFGSRDTAPGGLIAPKELSVASDGKIYVTQRGKRGVNVYRLTLG
jgi:DNA-binding beta-propeller fold protein YncE